MKKKKDVIRSKFLPPLDWGKSYLIWNVFSGWMKCFLLLLFVKNLVLFWFLSLVFQNSFVLFRFENNIFLKSLLFVLIYRFEFRNINFVFSCFWGVLLLLLLLVLFFLCCYLFCCCCCCVFNQVFRFFLLRGLFVCLFLYAWLLLFLFNIVILFFWNSLKREKKNMERN